MLESQARDRMTPEACLQQCHASSRLLRRGCTLAIGSVSGVHIVSFLRILLVILVVSFVAPALVFAQFPIPTTRSLEDNTPAQTRDLVPTYCRLASEGERQDPYEWAPLTP